MSESKLRKLQDDYVAACGKIGFPENTVVDCNFPEITVRDLRNKLYPQLESIISANMKLFPR